MSVGAVLAQKKEDGRIHPIPYASRTMNTSERKYSACEHEALAVIFSLKKFRVYLLRLHLLSWLPITRHLVKPFARTTSTVVWHVSYNS